MIKGRMRFRKDQKGLSTATTMMFLLAIFVFIYSTIIGTYLPEWAKTEEMRHMDEIAKRFIEIQIGVSSLQIYGQSGASITYPVMLGTKVKVQSIEILETVSSGGTLAFNNNKDSFIMYINDTTGGTSTRIHASYGTLLYTAYNTYYPSQVFAYMNDGVFRIQSNNSFVEASPSTELYVSREILENRTGEVFQYDGSTGLQYAQMVTFNVPGRPGNYNVSYSDWMVSDGEVAVYVNGVDTGLRLEPDVTGSWSGTRYLIINDTYLYDGAYNNITFLNLNNSAQPYETWGIRDVVIKSDFVRLTLPGIVLEGQRASKGGYGLVTVEFKLLSSSHVIYRVGGAGGNYTITVRSKEFVDAWAEIFTKMLRNSDLRSEEYNIIKTDGMVIVNIYGVDELVINKALVEVRIK